jgi:hypothetical protein
MGQWVTQMPPSQTGPGNTSSLPKFLPLSLLCLRNMLGKLGITPFEFLYGHPFLTNDLILDSEKARLTSHITQLANLINPNQVTSRHLSCPSSSPPPFCPSDLVLVKISHVSMEPLEPLWKGPYPVVLSTPQESKWLDWNFGSTSPESSTGLPLLTQPPINLLLRRLTTHASPSRVLNLSLRRLHQESNLCHIYSPLYHTLSHSNHSSKHRPMGDFFLRVDLPTLWGFSFLFLYSLSPISCLTL